MGDDAFFESIWISVQQAYRFYPDASFYIYDWGFTDEQRDLLDTADNVVQIIEWEDAVTVSSIDRLALLRTVKSHIYRYLPTTYSTPEEIEEARQREQNYAQKPFCLLDCLERCQSRLVYLDGDAFLVSRIDDLLQDDFDVGVTLRRPDEIVNERNRCQVLNAGVLFFNGTVDRTEAFLSGWIRRMNSTYEYLAEQTALTRIIEEACPGIFESCYNRGVIELQQKRASVVVLPCERYNFNWIEEGVDTEKTSIVHFKGGRHSDERFKELLQEVGISTPEEESVR